MPLCTAFAPFAPRSVRRGMLKHVLREERAPLTPHRACLHSRKPRRARSTRSFSSRKPFRARGHARVRLPTRRTRSQAPSSMPPLTQSSSMPPRTGPAVSGPETVRQGMLEGHRGFRLRITKKGPKLELRSLASPGSPGRIRTYDTLINSQLRYHCATGECGVRVRTREEYTDSSEARKGKSQISFGTGLGRVALLARAGGPPSLTLSICGLWQPCG